MVTTRQVEHGSVKAIVESDGSSRPGTRVTGGRVKVEGDNSGLDTPFLHAVKYSISLSESS